MAVRLGGESLSDAVRSATRFVISTALTGMAHEIANLAIRQVVALDTFEPE
jgi:hypothetical protein